MSFSRTQTIELDAPASVVFEVVSKVERLPDWATAFCTEILGKDQERYRIATPLGPLLFWIEADARHGTIDMHGGPSAELATTWPARVLDAPGGRSVFVFTAFRTAGMSDEQFEGQCAALGHELQTLKQLVEANGSAGRAR